VVSGELDRCSEGSSTCALTTTLEQVEGEGARVRAGREVGLLALCAPLPTGAPLFDTENGQKEGTVASGRAAEPKGASTRLAADRARPAPVLAVRHTAGARRLPQGPMTGESPSAGASVAARSSTPLPTPTMAARRQRAGGTGARRAMPNDGASSSSSSSSSSGSSSSSSSSSGGAIGSSRGGSGGRRTAPTPGCLPRLLILLAAAALLGRAAAAPFPPRCAMARCAKCQLLPAAYSAKNNRRPGLQRYCVKPAVGYATSADRRSVPCEPVPPLRGMKCGAARGAPGLPAPHTCGRRPRGQGAHGRSDWE
jgi:hypothetical protein